jgi:DNA segregation ATPase FtsK/SpoIIIE, S-DNA-T family
VASNNRKLKVKKAKPEKPPARPAERSPAAARRQAPNGAPPRRVHEVFGIVTLAAALLLGPSLLSVQASDGRLMGPFGHAVGTILHGALGFAGYVVILALLVVAIRIFAGGLGVEVGTPSSRTLWRERVGLVLTVLFAGALLHLIARPYRVAGASAGGLVGEVFAEILCSVASTAGAWVLALAGLALSLVLATNISWARAGLAAFVLLRRLAAALVVGARRSRERAHATLAQLGALLRRGELTAESGGAAALPPPIVRLDLCPDPYDARDERRRGRPAREANGEDEEAVTMPQDLEIGSGPAPAMAMPPLITASEELRAELAVIHESRSAIAPAIDIDVSDLDDPAPEPAPESAEPEITEPEASPASVEVELPPALTIVEPQFREASATEDEHAPDEKRVEQTDGPGFVLHGDTYRPPPLTLLDPEQTAECAIDREAIYRQADRLVKTLAEYKILGRVTEVHPGPVVTMYEFVPAPGTRISKIANLANDLAMSLAALRVRIVAPIPGKGAVGIEVPNDKRETVYYREIVAHDSFRRPSRA